MNGNQLVSVPPRCESSSSSVVQSNEYYDQDPLRIPPKKKVSFLAVIRTLFLIFCVVVACLFVYGKYKQEIVAFVAPATAAAVVAPATSQPVHAAQKQARPARQAESREAETPMLDALMDRLNNMLRN